MIKRDLYWDTLKFVLIFLVVYGHTVAASAPDGSFNKAVYNFIFLFHMPLFIFVSGRFSHVKDKTKYYNSILRILETYLIFQFVRSFVPLLFGKTLSFHLILSFFLFPEYTLWFLLCLIYWRLLVVLIPPNVLHNSPYIVLLICFAVSILGGFIPVKILSIQRAMTFLPFFFMGYYSTEIEIKQQLKKIHIGIPVLVILSIFLFVFYFLNTEIGFVLYGNSSYWFHSSLSPFLLCMARCLLLLVATLLGIMIMSLIRTQPFLAKMGKATLFIYIFHSFITQGIRVSVTHGYLSGNEMMLFVYAVVITIVLAYLSRIKIFNMWLNPVTFFKNYYVKNHNLSH